MSKAIRNHLSDISSNMENLASSLSDIDSYISDAQSDWDKIDASLISIAAITEDTPEGVVISDSDMAAIKAALNIVNHKLRERV